jgi:hypothetical protein
MAGRSAAIVNRSLMIDSAPQMRAQRRTNKASAIPTSYANAPSRRYETRHPILLPKRSS